jgi:DNA ligase-1
MSNLDALYDEYVEVKSMDGIDIYKTTKTGATQQWRQEIQGDKYRIVSGQVNGKLVVSEWTVCKPTNEGRSNERDGAAQAIFEVNANYKKKLDKDYHRTMDTISEGSHILPCMLAHEYSKAKLRKNTPAITEYYLQPKLNGMRCLVNKDGMWTRNGKPIVSCPHIFEALKPAFENNPDLIFDGELYNHIYKDNFNEIMSICKQMKPDAEDLEKSRQFAQYHMYDLQSKENDIFSLRSKRLEKFMSALFDPSCLKLVPTYKIESQEHANSLYAKFIEDLYEGGILRLDALYEGCRTWSLLKWKDFMDAEFILVDLESGDGNWSGKAKRAILKVADGRLFGAGITGTMAFCAKLLDEKRKYIGKPTTVNFFQYTPDGIPLFGRCKEFDRMDV